MPDNKSDDGPGCGTCLLFAILVCLGPPGWVIILALIFIFNVGNKK